MRDIRLFAVAALTMSGFALALRARPASALRNIVRVPSPRDPGDRSLPVDADAILLAINRASRVVPGGENCLVRAATGRALLARWGRHADVVFGVLKTPGGELRAHAWLRYDGRILMGGPLEPYAPLPDVGARL